MTLHSSEQLNSSSWEVQQFIPAIFSGKKGKYCVCIPVINEGERIRAQLREMFECGVSDSVDIIIADGGSTDGSLDEVFLRSIGVRALLTKQDSGNLSAQLRMAYAFALQEGYDGVITIDGNGKDGVDAIPRFVDALESGVDFVQGSRFVPGGEAVNTPLKRWLAIRFIHAPLISLGARHWYTDTTNGFRGYSRRYLLDDRVQPFRAVFKTYELLAYLSVRATQLGFVAKEIPVRRAYPAEGATPTKIHGRAHADLLSIVWKTLLGRYNP